MIKQTAKTVSAVMLLCLGAGCVGEDPSTSSVTSEPLLSPLSVRLIASRLDMPGISAQTTTRGKTINTLHPFNNRIYLGYGDYDANTGPISILSYSPAAGTFDASFSAQTEEINKYYGFNGDLYAPVIDSRNALQTLGVGSVFRLDGPTMTWSERTPIVNAFHVFDATAFAGKLYVGIGSNYGLRPVIYSSLDKGLTWTAAFSLPLVLTTEFARCYGLGATTTSLFASGYIFSSLGAKQFAYKYSGVRWSALAGLPGYGLLHPVVLNNSMRIVNMAGHLGFGGAYYGSYAVGTTSLVAQTVFPVTPTSVNWSIRKADLTNPLDLMCTLIDTSTGTHEIYSTTDFVTWTPVGTLPALAADRYSSIACQNGEIYLGTANGDFYVVD
ncbi:MAG: hypothetical protein V2A73_05210 [Pseudomonadota bacterium]